MARPLEFRERTEELERASLSTWATLAAETKGRDRHEDADPLRTVFQVDADRILASAPFRALGGKRAWLPVAAGPSRMQQALLVSRVGGLVSRALRLNEDLVTAIAYGHVLGATPFAAAGEEALSAFLEGPYDAAAQAVDLVERGHPAAGLGQPGGLNLSWETRDGMLHHRWDGPAPATLEGQAVRLAAYVVASVWPVVEALGTGQVSADDVPAQARGHLGPDWPARCARHIAAVSADAPELVLGDDLGEAVAALAAVSGRLQLGDAAIADRHRAVHCLRSLVVYDVERRPAHPGALIDALQDLALATEADVLTRFRAAFEPSGGAGGPLRA